MSDLGWASVPAGCWPPPHNFLVRFLASAHGSGSGSSRELQDDEVEEGITYRRLRSGTSPPIGALVYTAPEWRQAIVGVDGQTRRVGAGPEEKSSDLADSWLHASEFETLHATYNLLTPAMLREEEDHNKAMLRGESFANAPSTRAQETRPSHGRQGAEVTPQGHLPVNVLRAQLVSRGQGEKAWVFRMDPGLSYCDAQTGDTLTQTRHVQGEPVTQQYPQLVGTRVLASQGLASTRGSRGHSGVVATPLAPRECRDAPPGNEESSRLHKEILVQNQQIRLQEETIIKLQRAIDHERSASKSARDQAATKEVDDVRRSRDFFKRKSQKLQNEIVGLMHRVAREGSSVVADTLPPPPPSTKSAKSTKSTAPTALSLDTAAVGGASSSGAQSSPPAYSDHEFLSPPHRSNAQEDGCRSPKDAKVPFARSRQRHEAAAKCLEQARLEASRRHLASADPAPPAPPDPRPRSAIQDQYRQRVSRKSHEQREQELLERRAKTKRRIEKEQAAQAKDFRASEPDRRRLGYRVQGTVGADKRTALDKTWESVQSKDENQRKERTITRREELKVARSASGDKIAAFVNRQFLIEKARRRRLNDKRREFEEKGEAERTSFRASTKQVLSSRVAARSVESSPRGSPSVLKGSRGTWQHSQISFGAPQRSASRGARTGLLPNAALDAAATRTIKRLLASQGFPMALVEDTLPAVILREFKRLDAAAPGEKLSGLGVSRLKERVIEAGMKALAARMPGYRHVGRQVEVRCRGQTTGRKGVVQSVDLSKQVFRVKLPEKDHVVVLPPDQVQLLSTPKDLGAMSKAVFSNMPEPPAVAAGLVGASKGRLKLLELAQTRQAQSEHEKRTLAKHLRARMRALAENRRADSDDRDPFLYMSLMRGGDAIVHQQQHTIGPSVGAEKTGALTSVPGEAPPSPKTSSQPEAHGQGEAEKMKSEQSKGRVDGETQDQGGAEEQEEEEDEEYSFEDQEQEDEDAEYSDEDQEQEQDEDC